MPNLYYNTITPFLLQTLNELMHESIFEPFRLVGGTALSLQKGHRFSEDIDLFTDAPYGSLDFNTIDSFLNNKYSYVRTNNSGVTGMGRSYIIGRDETENVKLDIFYTEKFIRDVLIIEEIRMASIEDIIAMKLEVVQNIGRKKDFWDLHELMIEFNLEKMLALHLERHPYAHDSDLIRANFIQFDEADIIPDPICLRGKYWEVIKSDLVDFVKSKGC